jgi:hypothetical protein
LPEYAGKLRISSDVLLDVRLFPASEPRAKFIGDLGQQGFPQVAFRRHRVGHRSDSF